MNWEQVTKIQSRAQLATALAREGGVGVELGVAAGDYSVCLLSAPGGLRLYSIDRWLDHHDQVEMEAAQKRLSVFGNRSYIIRSTFAEAADLFANAFFDFVYIDGYAHTGQEGGKTLSDWWPLVKPGGVFAGHDYCREYVPTMVSVDRFVESRNLPLHATSERLASWITLKP